MSIYNNRYQAAMDRCHGGPAELAAALDRVHKEVLLEQEIRESALQTASAVVFVPAGKFLVLLAKACADNGHKDKQQVQDALAFGHEVSSLKPYRESARRLRTLLKERYGN